MSIYHTNVLSRMPLWDSELYYRTVKLSFNREF